MNILNFFTNISEKKQVIIATFVLIVLAAWPRLNGLGELSFYMDEETTALASRALAEGSMPQMPSGMPYMRSLLHTALNAVSAKLIGLENELAYRLPSAIFGILTIPLIFLLLRSHVGMSLALLVAMLLAFSEWHIITSRQGRMYAPFLFFYISFAFSIFHWARTDKTGPLILSIILFVATATLHNLGVLAAFIPLIAILIKDYSKTKALKLITFSFVGGVSAYLYGKLIVARPYHAWKAANGLELKSLGTPSLLENISPTLDWPTVVGLLLGLVTGIWLATRIKYLDRENGFWFRTITIYITAITTGLFLVTGNLYGAFLSTVIMLLVFPDSLPDLLKTAYKPLIVLTALTTVSATIQIMESNTIVTGIKSLLTFPYPVWIELAGVSLVMTLLFIFMLAYLIYIKNKQYPSKHSLLLIVSCGLFPMIIVGIFMKSAPARYLLQSYPFILISAGVSLYIIFDYVLSKFTNLDKKYITFAVYLIGLSGAIGGHGIVPAYKAGTIQHGDYFNKHTLIFPVYPDHKSPGEYVRDNKASEDIVIAEDVLEQKWYVGSVNYWLRDFDADSGFLYKSDDQHLHDIYTNSIAMTPDIFEKLAATIDRKIWLITSAETFYNRKHFLNEQQLNWLANIEKNQKAVFVGKDKITKVYCINCENLK